MFIPEDKIFETEKNFKLRVVKADTARGSSDESEEEEKSRKIKMCAKARRNTKDWRKWYKFE